MGHGILKLQQLPAFVFSLGGRLFTFCMVGAPIRQWMGPVIQMQLYNWVDGIITEYGGIYGKNFLKISMIK